jgi:hypothetical protein
VSARAYDIPTESLRLIVAANGRVKSEVFLYRRDDPTHPLLTDTANLSSQADREGLLVRLDESLRAEAERAFCQAAADIAADRTRPKQGATAQPDAGPFPTIEPWHEAVDGRALLDDLCALLRRYVVLPPHAVEALVLWLLHTYVADVADYTPYINVTSPVRECGKSTLLEMLFNLAWRAQLTGGITAAALYRRIERYAPTMLLDELDTRLRGDGGEALRGVLNTGFHRSGRVTICVGDDHEDRDYTTFCPKVLAGIGRVWDTVASRSITIRLTRASREQLVGMQKVRGDRITAECAPYQQRLRRWADDHRDTLRGLDPAVPDALGARHADVWRQLLAIADTIGEPWAERARAAACALHGVDDEETDSGLLFLSDVRDLFRTTGANALLTARIIEALVKLEHRPWSEFRHDKPITPRGVAALLGRFGVKPKTVRDGTETPKGYTLDDLASSFNTYLPRELSATSATRQHGNELGVADTPDRGATPTGGSATVADSLPIGVADRARSNSANHNVVADVADRTTVVGWQAGDVRVTPEGSELTPEGKARLLAARRRLSSDS